MPSLEEIESDFQLLDDWEDRYRYVIELGRALTPLDPALKTEATKVRGCASQVWLIVRRGEDKGANGPLLHFFGESDSQLVQGLIAILLAVYEGRTARDVAAIDAHGILKRLGLSEHLTPQRSNGLNSMIERIRSDAATALADVDRSRYPQAQ